MIIAPSRPSAQQSFAANISDSRSVRFRLVGIIAVAFAAVCLLMPPSASAGLFGTQKPVSFNGASTIFVADLNKDAKPDMVAVSSSGLLYWCQGLSNGTFGPAQTIATGLTGAASVSVADLNHDGLPDIVVGGGEKIQWYANLGAGQFLLMPLVASSVNGTCKLFVADIDRNGKPDIVSASSGAGTVTWYSNNGNATFTSHLVASLGAGAVSVFVVDADVDGAPDLVCANDAGIVAWFHNNGAGTFGAAQTISTGAAGASSVFVADLNRDGRPDVIVAGGNKVAWYPGLGSGAFGAEQTISSALNGATAVSAANINGDGLQDVVCTAAGDNTASWFSNTGGGNFGARQVIANNMSGTSDVAIADIDQDGDLDVSVASIGSIVWYTNRSVHRSVLYSKRTSLATVTTGIGYASVAAADLDGDGLPDAVYALGNDVSKIAWRHSNGDGTFGPEQLIDGLSDYAGYITTGDINGDGRVDLVVGTQDIYEVQWYENKADGSFEKHVISSSGDVSFPTCVAVADIDGDGKLDVLCASWTGRKIGWYRNLGGGNFGPQQIISTSPGPWFFFCADLNGDGKTDVVSVSTVDQKVSWRQNNGEGTFGPEQVIASGLQGNYAVYAADVDKDGRLDVIASSAVADTVFWYRNLGGGSFSTVPQVVTQGQHAGKGVNVILASDVDRAGLQDLVAGTSYPGGQSLADWFKNAGGGNFSQPQSIVSGVATGIVMTSVSAADFNGDGATSLLWCSPSDNAIVFYPNTGGSFALVGTSTAPATMQEGQLKNVLRVDLTHRGRTGDDDVVLKKMKLQFQNGGGTPLPSTEASNLIRSVSIWAHQNPADSSAFDAARDSMLFRNASPSFTNGALVLDLSGADPNDFRASHGVPRTLFVVVELQQDASSHAPNQFQVINVTDQAGAVAGIDAQAGSMLTAEFSQSVSTPVITISANQSPSAGGLPNIALKETVAGSVVPLFSAFSDGEDSVAQLTYKVTGNTNPGLFDFVGIDPLSGKLVLNYRAGVKGDSLLTITATDSGGKTVSAAFHATANLITTLSDWRADRYGSTTTTSPGDLSSYAFALSPSGANAPQMRMQKGGLVFSHRKPKYATDLNYSYQVSQDLVHWIPAVKGVHYFPYTNDLGDGTVSENCVLLVKWNRAFLRAGASLVAPVAGTPPSNSGSTSATSPSALNTAPTTTGIADVTILDPASTTTIPLFNSFSDAEDAPQQMTYSVTITTPGLLDFASIDGSNGLLKLKANTGAFGSSTLTVTARDSGGKTVSTNFTVTVAKIQTFADWTSLYSGSLPSGQSQRFIDYGLSINPTQSGGVGVQPALKRENGSLVFSHLRPKFATDLSHQYQISSDLVHWIPAVNGVHYFDFSTDRDDGTRQVNLLLLVDWSRAFVRVGVSVANP